MTILETVKNKLEKHKEFRERNTRGKFLAILSLRHMGETDADMNYESKVSVHSLAQFGRVYSSYERAWRKITKDYPELRGSDYDEGDELEEFKLNELGYK